MKEINEMEILYNDTITLVKGMKNELKPIINSIQELDEALDATLEDIQRDLECSLKKR